MEVERIGLIARQYKRRVIIFSSDVLLALLSWLLKVPNGFTWETQYKDSEQRHQSGDDVEIVRITKAVDALRKTNENKYMRGIMAQPYNVSNRNR